MSWKFLHAERLWLLLAVLALVGGYVLTLVRGRRRAVKFTNIELLESILPKQVSWRRHLVTGLLLTGLGISVFALAQPYREEQVADKRSIIMVVLDVSLSMEATDVDPDRITAARAQAIEFVDGVDETIEVGLISFSQTVKLRVPPTLDRGKVTKAIDRLNLEEGTAIGDAIIEASNVLTEEFRDRQTSGPDDTTDSSDENADDPIGNGDGPPAAIVILTDGETVDGRIPGEEGAVTAAEAGIPVFGIVFGTVDGTIELEDPVTGEIVTQPVPVKDEELTQAAEITGGEFYKAESSGDLSDVYSDIQDRLEPALKLPEPERIELTVRYLFVALLLMLLAIALGFWWLGGLN
jgi:Ca-activated chloride channel homolog